MIKRVAFIAGLLVCFATPALSAQGPYVSASVGVTMPNDSDVNDQGFDDELAYDAGFAIGAALGYNLGVGRLEGEIAYKSVDLDEYTAQGLGTFSVNGDSSLLSFMANGYYDIDASPVLKPFLMGGIGLAQFSIDSSDLAVDDDDTVFAYQVGAGLGIVLNKQVTLDVSYRFMGTSDADITGADVSYDSHNFLAGVRVNF